MNLHVDRAVAGAFPDYRAYVIVAEGVAAGPSDDASRRLLVQAAEHARGLLDGRRPADLPEIAAWRTAFAAFGAKPSRYPSSTEALLKRVARGDELPPVNRLVDCYNAVSVAHRLPIGGEDADAVAGAVVLRHATSGDTFDLPGPDGAPDSPFPGEVVWADDAGVTCRCWNWRQGLRTRLTETTVHAYFLLEALPPFGTAELDEAALELEANLAAVGAGGRLSRLTLP
jgi:DNA/RNA-binding domain of Phe-tRNA-synthetase-like protein